MTALLKVVWSVFCENESHVTTAASHVAVLFQQLIIPPCDADRAE